MTFFADRRYDEIIAIGSASFLTFGTAEETPPEAFPATAPRLRTCLPVYPPAWWSSLTASSRGITSEESPKLFASWAATFRVGKATSASAKTPTVLGRFNKWIRRRIRSAACKQWRTGKTRYARLRELGLSHDLAAARQGISGVLGGLAVQKPSLMPCPPLTSIAWDFLPYTAQLVRNPTEPPCTDPYARWCARESE